MFNKTTLFSSKYLQNQRSITKIKNMESESYEHANCLVKSNLRSFDVWEETVTNVLYSYYHRCFNYWNDLLGWKCIQTAQPWQEHQGRRVGWWEGGEERKHRHSSSSTSDKQRIIFADERHSEFHNRCDRFRMHHSKTIRYLQ